jgi:hypothetical protein
MTQWTFVQTATGLPEYLAPIALIMPRCVPGTLRRPPGKQS